ncbi:MAG: DNA methylase N-4 [Armatimonadetes bacterium]|nr:DNA methylase N-4 [Armatimonadota bacterium]
MLKQPYEEFLQTKIKLATPRASLENAPLHPSLFPHQAAIARWALKNGRGLIAASFGLGKSRVQCAVAQALVAQSNQPFLVVCPLGVKHQFAAEDGPSMGMEWQYVRSDAEIEAATTPYLITNYERVRDGGIDPRKHDFCGASLDEGSVLRSLGSKTYQIFQELFADVPNRYVCTATPAPNKFREIIYYAQFLGVMDVGQALTRWFERDPQKAGNLKLHPQHERDFWIWVASWALFLSKPSDLGFSDEGYDLPELRVHWHRVLVDHTRAHKVADSRGQLNLILGGTTSVQDEARENRATLEARVAKMQEILAANQGRHALLWHNLEDERRAVEKAVPESVSVFGSQELELREQRILDFSHGDIPILATKPEIAGSGCNFQRHCSLNIFLGVNYRFEDFIQAIHRTHRFQQKEPVDVHIIYAESQDSIIQSLKEKWALHEKLSQTMQDIVIKYGLSHEAMNAELQRRIGLTRVEVAGERFTAINNDCVREIANLETNSVGLIHTSIPFGNHYEYTTNVEDFGHNDSDEDFFVQMDFLIPELLRALKPGRLAAIHVKDRILYGHQTKSGMLEVQPFSDETVAAFRKHGFLFEGRRTIVTDVVRENNSTYRLTWKEMCKDATKMGCGLPEYLLLFRKPPSDNANSYADEPVLCDTKNYSLARWQVDAHAFWRSNGVLPALYDFHAHVAGLEAKEATGSLPKTFFADPPRTDNPDVWDDVTFMRCLNANQMAGGKQKHICPLPFDIVERTIELYSNPGDLILEPFMGIGTVPYVAIKKDRRAYGIELNSEYFANAVRYCRDAEAEALAPSLFDELVAA